MNQSLLVAAVVLSALFVVLLVGSIVLQRWLERRILDSSPVDLTNEHGEIDPVKQIQHLKKSTAEFGIKFDELKFGKMIGKGSQGEVFKANWRGSTVAVKKVDTRKVPPEIVEEFASEAQIMRRLRHPALTLFMGVSLEHPHLCIVTEFVTRGSLFDIIHDAEGALTWNKCIGIAVDVARGLTYLHAHAPPILHRDLKSLNILVDENWRGKVADFGMTRFQEDGTMTQCGSPLWMAPEMIRNDPYDDKSDVYSFGIVLWEMYTRKIPYRDLGLNPSHLVVKVVKEHLRPPIPKQCPKAYKQLMQACWAPQPEKRPTFPQILKIVEGFAADPHILNHKPMSSRDSTIIVRPDRVEEPDPALAVGGVINAVGAAMGLQSERAWQVDAKEVTFYNEAAATFQDLTAGGVEPLPASGKGARTRSLQNPLSLAPDALKPIASPSNNGTSEAAVPGTPSETSAETPKVTRASSTTKKLTTKSSGATTANSSAPSSPSIKRMSGNKDSVPPVEGTPAPLVHNTTIKSTKEAKSEEERAGTDGAQLASQGRGFLLGRFRTKVVAVKPCYLSRTHLVLSNEERVAADLDGGKMKDTRLGMLMKRIASLRHPNITLFLGGFVDTTENLRTKLKESGLEAAMANDAAQSSAAASSSSSTAAAAAVFVASLPPPPPECDYYLGFVQEFMSRGTLHDLFCNSSMVIDWDTMIQLLIDAASGMAYLHGGSSPIIHQDFSSHRLLVDKNWRVKVTDFGFVDLQKTLNGQLPPPTPWSSPEYIKNPNATNLSLASNVFSFGCVMWQALARKPLWNNQPLTKELEARIVKQGDRPPLPSSLSVQTDLKNLIEKTWMADPHARPSFAFILDELNRLKKLGPPRIQLKLGVNAHKYRKSKTVFAYRSKDPVTIMKDWGTNVGKAGAIIIFSGDDDVYLCDEDVFNATYEKLEPGAAIGDDQPLRKRTTPGAAGSSSSATSAVSGTLELTAAGSSATHKDVLLPPSDPGNDNDRHEYRKTGTILARMMEDAFSVKTNGGIEHGMAGDYLVQNESGDQWSIEARTFLELYERWD